MEAIPPGEAPSAEAPRYRYALAGVFRSLICAETAFFDIGVYERSRRTCSLCVIILVGGYYLRWVAYALGSSCGFRLPVSRRLGARHRAAGQGAVGKLLVTARGFRPRPGFVDLGESEVLRKRKSASGKSHSSSPLPSLVITSQQCRQDLQP